MTKKTNLLVAAVVALSINVSPAEGVRQNKSAVQNVTAKAGADSTTRRPKLMGGLIERPGSQKGKAIIVDLQTDVSGAKTADAVRQLSDICMFGLEYEKDDPSFAKNGDWTTLMKQKSANVAIFLVSETNTPSLLISPDECWAVLNVRKLGEGLEKKDWGVMLPIRLAKQTIRALALLGGAASRFPSSLAGAYSVRDLDRRPDMIPMDQVDQLMGYFRAHGMANRRMVPYRLACQQGWAPQPTNELQRTVWDEVHKLPTNPLPLVKPTK